MCEALVVTVAEAARALSLGRSATYKLIQTGALRSLKIGGSRRVAMVDLKQFVEQLREECKESE